MLLHGVCSVRAAVIPALCVLLLQSVHTVCAITWCMLCEGCCNICTMHVLLHGVCSVLLHGVCALCYCTVCVLCEGCCTVCVLCEGCCKVCAAASYELLYSVCTVIAAAECAHCACCCTMCVSVFCKGCCTVCALHVLLHFINSLRAAPQCVPCESLFLPHGRLSIPIRSYLCTLKKHAEPEQTRCEARMYTHIHTYAPSEDHAGPEQTRCDGTQHTHIHKHTHTHSLTHFLTQTYTHSPTSYHAIQITCKPTSWTAPSTHSPTLSITAVIGLV